jgi:hypothetical protein
VDPPEAAVSVLRNVHRLCEPGGIVLDLTCVPPPAGVEVRGRLIGRLDQERFLERAAHTEQAVAALVVEGLLVDEASLRHEVLEHYETAADLIEDVDGRRYSRLPPAVRESLASIEEPVVERSTCLLRRLRVQPAGQ